MCSRIRLSADGDTEVLLLVAGRLDEKREISFPAAFSELFESDVDWNCHTDPQPELDDRERYRPRGKTLGGSSERLGRIRGRPAHRRAYTAVAGTIAIASCHVY